METITIYTAGKSRGNPGPAGVAVLVLDSTGAVLLEHTALIGNAEDNFAAYQAVVEALEVAQEKFKDKTLEMKFNLQLTNEFVKKQINGEEPVTDARSVSHFIHTHNLRVQHYPHLTLTLVESAANKALKLVDETLDEK
jgi:ribonuclease HI